jgi:hypothetical protein
MVVKNPRNTDPPDDTPTPSDTSTQAAALAAIIAALGGGDSSSAGTIELPEGYSPPPRTVITGTSEPGAQGRRPIVGQLTGRGLVNQFGEIEKLPNSQNIREEYTDDEIRFEWLGLPYEVRKKYIEQFQEIGIISKRQVLDPNLTGNTELAAFSSVLANANIEGRTWRAVLPIIASRAKNLGTDSPRYRPTSIADIRRATQAQATSILGRGLTPEESKPLAQRIQERETRQQTRKSGDQPTSTSTLIEQEVQKDFGAEAQAFNFARFAQSALGYAGSSAGAQPDVELETMGGM